MKRIKPLFLIIIGFLLGFSLHGQTNEPVKLAIIAESPDASAVCDILTAQLSANSNVHLLERDEIDKVYHEQGMSAENRDDVKLGRLLGADGVLLLETLKENQNSYLSVRLLAAKPGVVVLAEKFPWPGSLTVWAPTFAQHLVGLTPKLIVQGADAVPVSVVNFRSAIQSEESEATERLLKLLVIERLSQEARFFVLERERMQEMEREKGFNADESAFWNGSYLLEGTVDQNNYSSDVITVDVRLTPPKGGAPLSFQVSGARTNLTDVINQLADKVAGLLNVKSTAPEWAATDEAQKYLEETVWALHWGLYTEAQAASESAWALGRQNAEMAMLRIRSYAQMPLDNVVTGQESDLTNPPNFNFSRQFEAQALPDARQLKLLTRALELYCDDSRYFTEGTNNLNAEATIAGLQLLRSGAVLLESYYFAAELRDEHETELADLRGAMRRTMYILDDIPRTDIEDNYLWFKWEEGCLCFDEPEAALPMFREILKAGYHPDDTPRLVGWNWEKRKRVDALTRQLVAGFCSDTNIDVHMEGLYLAVVLAPHDQEGTLEKTEQELVSEMWDNRHWLYSPGGDISLVERLKNVLYDKYGYLEIDPNRMQYFDHEPYAGLKYKLQMDFLTNSLEANPETFKALFTLFGHLETPAQARELLPLAVNYEERFHLAPKLDYYIKNLQKMAGTGSSPAQGAKIEIPTQNIFEAPFIKWNLLRPGIDSDRKPAFTKMIFKNGNLWVHVAYLRGNNSPYSDTSPGLLAFTDSQNTYLRVDPQTGVQDEIPFPDEFGTPDDGFEVSTDSLFVNAQGHLYRYQFWNKSWDEIPIPMEPLSQLVWLEGSLYVSRSDGLMKVNPVSKQAAIVVSTRRQPALNKMDKLWPSNTWLYARSDGKLGVLSQADCYGYAPDSDQWDIQTLPVDETNSIFPLRAFYTSANGAQTFLTGITAHRYLVGYWNDDHAPEVLLMERAPFPYNMADPKSSQLTQPIRWNWPQGFPLEPSSIAGDIQKLWVLCPRKVWDASVLPANEPVQFFDDRQATLFYFGPESARPLFVPLKFKDIDSAQVFKPIINGHSMDPLSPAGGGYIGSQKIHYHIGNAAYWFKTPAGLIYGARNYGGHWLIPNSELGSMLPFPPETTNQQVKTQTGAAVNPTRI